jgi:Zn-dependent protease
VDFNNLIQTVLVYALPVILAITLHEAAHGFVARFLGDNTAYMMGRVTLNPASHIDPVGTILMPLILYIATQGAFLFGYAKPVPVKVGKLRRPKRDMVWVALAGPGINLAQALLWALALHGLRAAGLQEDFFLLMCMAGVLVNFVMAAFNLFPLPPLDGGRVLVGLLPARQAYALSRIEPWGFFIVMALVVFNVINSIWMMPLIRLGYALLDALNLATPFPYIR